MAARAIKDSNASGTEWEQYFLKIMQGFISSSQVQRPPTILHFPDLLGNRLRKTRNGVAKICLECTGARAILRLERGENVMDTTIVFALDGVVIAWSIAFGIIRRWGPGIVRRTLFCPEKQVSARVTFRRREGSFGSLKAADVQECSLFPNPLVTCNKQCLG